MVKNDLLRNVVSKVEGGTQKDAERYLAAFAEVVLETLRNDKEEKVTLPGIGTFKVKEVPERKGTVMMGENKGTEWVKPAHSELVFSILKSVKEI